MESNFFRKQNETVDGAGEENEGFEQSFNSVVDPTEESYTKNKQVNQEKSRLVNIYKKLFFYLGVFISLFSI